MMFNSGDSQIVQQFPTRQIGTDMLTSFNGRDDRHMRERQQGESVAQSPGRVDQHAPAMREQESSTEERHEFSNGKERVTPELQAATQQTNQRLIEHNSQ